MNDNKFCSVCKINIDKNNYKKNRTVCKSCYNKSKRKNNNNTLIQKKVLLLTNNQKLEKLIYTIIRTEHSILDFQIVVRPI